MNSDLRTELIEKRNEGIEFGIIVNYGGDEKLETCTEAEMPETVRAFSIPPRKVTGVFDLTKNLEEQLFEDTEA